MSDRERFLAQLLTLPLLRSDAAIVLCGEDAEPRADVAVALLKSGGVPLIVLSGGIHDPPRRIGTIEIAKHVYAKGVAPDRLLTEVESTNTREQAVSVVTMAMERDWTRLMLCVSAYHAPRAFLTFLNALQESGVDDTIRLLLVPADAPWCKSPAGSDSTRLDLLATEFEKCERYAEHVAPFTDGLAYLARWEGR